MSRGGKKTKINGAAAAPPAPAYASPAPVFQTSGGAPGVRFVAPWSPHARFAVNAPPAIAQATVPAVVEAPAPPPPAPAAAPPPAPHAPEPQTFVASPEVAAYQEHQRRLQEQAQATRSTTQLPQGETSLLLQWANVVTTRRIPAVGCTIWIQSMGSEPYELFVTGNLVESTSDGHFPDRALYEWMMKNRRKANEHERFIGRIMSPAIDGTMQPLGGGFVSLPPVPQSPQSQWSQPGAYGAPHYAPHMPPPGAPPAPPGYPPYPPPGYPPPYGYPYPPPYGFGAMGMPPGMMPYGFQPQPPPAAVAKDPAAMEIWQRMEQTRSEGTAQMFALIRDIYTMKNAAAPAQAPQAPLDPMHVMGQAIDMIGRLNGIVPKPDKEPAERPGIRVVNVDGTKIVENKDGEIDTVSTGVLGIKDAVTSYVAMKRQENAQKNGGSGGGAPGVRRPAAVAQTNGAGAPGVKH